MHKENDELVVCPNCGQFTLKGEMSSISGYHGCKNQFKDGECFLNDLAPRVSEYRVSTDEKKYLLYRIGALYSAEFENLKKLHAKGKI